MWKHIGSTFFVVFFALGAWSQDRAGIVIQNSTGELITRCIEISDGTTLIDMLDQSGFFLITDPGTATICTLHDDGRGDCTPHPDGFVWTTARLNGDQWETSQVNQLGTTVDPGSVYGFAYGPEGSLPEIRTYAEVCEVVSTAAVVVDTEDQRTIRVVDFFGETLTGTQLLLRSGLEVGISATSFGNAVCSIDGVGQPVDDCFGDPLFRFWGLNLLDVNDEWASSPVGSDDAIVFDGNVHGWFFSTFGTPQPPITAEEVFAQSSIESWDAYR